MATTAENQKTDQKAETIEDWARQHGLSTAPAIPSVRAGEPCPEKRPDEERVAS